MSTPGRPHALAMSTLAIAQVGPSSTAASPAGAAYGWDADSRTLCLHGHWTTAHLATLGDASEIAASLAASLVATRLSAASLDATTLSNASLSDASLSDASLSTANPGATRLSTSNLSNISPDLASQSAIESSTGSAAAHFPRLITLDGSALAALDTAGALMVERLRLALASQGWECRLRGFAAPHLSLISLVGEHLAGTTPGQVLPPPQAGPGSLEHLGRLAWDWVRQGLAILSFGGETCLTFLGSLRHPRRLRWRQTIQVIEQDGVFALPVLGMLAFLIGVVIAYQSGVQLRVYGGNLYVVDLLTITVMRELGPMMTAIVVAGRSGSAYAAQIGTMQVTDEIDALRSIGVSPLELLVVPKLLGLVLTLPLLTIFANLMAIGGGMVMSALFLDLSPPVFLHRIPEAVSINSLMTGVAKAPVFAVAIALVGCFQGFQVRDSADSVGRHTTISVVQAIVWVIVIDAAFSVIYSWMEI